MREDFQEHVMPSGQVCFYRDGDHSYWRSIEPKKRSEPDGEHKGRERLAGISTVAGALDFDPDPLMRWAAKSNGEGIAILAAEALDLEDIEAMRANLAWLESAGSIWRTLEAHQLTYMDLRDQAAVRGTNVHKHALHALSTGAKVPAFEHLSESEKGYAKGVVKFWMECWPKPLSAERVVMDLDLGVAGRFDLLCKIERKTILLDCKTSGFISLGHHVQIAGYEHCARVSGVGESDERMILQVDERGGYDLIPVRAEVDDFKCAVQAHRRAKRIKAEARQDRQARQLALVA